MTDEEIDQRLRQFEGKIVVQSAGTHTMPDGRVEPAIAVELAGQMGPYGVGKALGSIIRAYLAGNDRPGGRPGDATEVAVVMAVMQGLTAGMNTAELVHVQQGKAQ